MFTIAVIIVPLALITYLVEFAMAIPNMVAERRQLAMFRRERTMFR